MAFQTHNHFQHYLLLLLLFSYRYTKTMFLKNLRIDLFIYILPKKKKTEQNTIKK